MADDQPPVTRMRRCRTYSQSLAGPGQSSIYSDLLKLSRWAGRSTSTAGRHRVAVQAGLSPNPGRLSRWLGQIVIGGFGLFTSFFDELLVDEFVFLLEGPLVVFLVVGTFGFVLLLGVTPKVRQQRSKYSHTPLDRTPSPTAIRSRRAKSSTAAVWPRGSASLAIHERLPRDLPTSPN